jgi:hypothetical protein
MNNDYGYLIFNVKGDSMHRIYEAWIAYAMLVTDAVSAYCRRTEHWPFVVSMGLLLIPMFAADWFLPRWASLSLYAAIGLPMVWIFGTMLWVYFTYYGSNRDNR